MSTTTITNYVIHLKSSSLPYSCFAFVKKQKETQKLFNKGLGVSLIFKEVFKLQVSSTLNNLKRKHIRQWRWIM